jgi:hypothetical protein
LPDRDIKDMSKIVTKQNKMNCELMLTYDTPALRQTGSRNLTGQKTLPMIWGTWFLYTLNIYAHVSSHFSQQLLMAEI